MGTFRLDRVLDLLTSIELLVGLLWVGLAALTVALLILMQTRWGQSRPLRKCLVLSLLAHLLLVGYATTVQIVGSPRPPGEPVIRVSLVDGPSPEAANAQESAGQESASEEKPWEELPHDAAPQQDPIDLQRRQPEPQQQNRTQPTHLPGDPALDRLSPVEVDQPEPNVRAVDGPTGRSSPGKSAEPIKAPAAQRREPPPVTLPSAAALSRTAVVPITHSPPVRASDTGVPVALLQQRVPLPRLASPPTSPDPATLLAGATDRLASVGRAAPEAVVPSAADPQLGPDTDQGRTRLPLPDIYKLRVAPDRSRRAQRRGATPQTEEAVQAALRWLAANQKPDGRWDAGEHGAGRELVVAGRDRQGAGIRADTGMTGLALLSFLASGHTHREGPYRENVRRGLQYLLKAQARDGNLAGRATPYAQVYCHAMAAFALSEAYGMTGDDRLEQPVRRAIGYTVATQNPTDGGYRYNPGDPGDTSVCGWQLMALKSAELAGIPIPQKTRDGLIRYLRSVSAGKYGGLASYRPKEQITRPMTAEALVCWQFLGLPREHPAGNEAGDYLLGELPGQGKTNLYYWYYATLGTYQLHGAHWQRWNEALQRTLVASQRKTGPLAGSWDPNSVWGCYGGRVYSTTMAALCLEVYYRFLPLYADAAAAEFSPGVHAGKESPRGRGG